MEQWRDHVQSLPDLLKDKIKTLKETIKNYQDISDDPELIHTLKISRVTSSCLTVIVEYSIECS